MRIIETHKVNNANEQLELKVLDERGSGGACHLYEIRGYNSETNLSDPFVKRYGKGADHSTILFQNGSIQEVGVNGTTHEILLAILEDRLAAFQNGPYACEENALALVGVRVAQTALKLRMEKRVQRGVEGTHTV